MEKYEKMKSFDPEIYAAIQDETNRQNNKIELIASENFVSERIMEANGSPLTNKYAEGYPGKRYYGGCEHVDVVPPPNASTGKGKASRNCGFLFVTWTCISPN